MIRQKNIRKNGFTLIELLIVVAIIAILAAIAIPNFLAAQIRAKVSRVKAEMQTVATALESYEVDNNRYPQIFHTPPVGFNNGWDTPDFEPPYFYRLVPLSTPIAYITTIPFDVFNPGTDPWSANHGNVYAYFTSDPSDVGFLFGGGVFPTPSWYSENPNEAWRLASYGPTLTFSPPVIFSGYKEAQMGLTEYDYDPTNGTVSPGFIVRFGP